MKRFKPEVWMLGAAMFGVGLLSIPAIILGTLGYWIWLRPDLTVWLVFGVSFFLACVVFMTVFIRPKR